MQRMKRFLFYFLILTTPFFCLIVVNEVSRSEPYQVTVFGKSEPSINPQQKDTKRCTWDCHTHGCSHRENNCINVGIIDVLYQNIINSLNLKEGGDVYQLMNVLFLVIIWPLVMFGLLVVNVELYIKRKKKA
jgi:hypothetical protein